MAFGQRTLKGTIGEKSWRKEGTNEKEQWKSLMLRRKNNGKKGNILRGKAQSSMSLSMENHCIKHQYHNGVVGEGQGER